VKQLAGKVGIITGASRGIGAEIARLLAHEGAELVLNYNKSEEKAHLLRDEIEEAGGKALCVQGDVSKLGDAARLAEAAMEVFGRIDFLVNNAGINRDITLSKMQLEQWNEVLEVNLNSVYNCSRAVIPHLMAQTSGSIISISSIIGQSGGFGQTNYSAAKAGMVGFTKSAALELARYGITVNAICPGFIETCMLSSVPPEVKDKIKGRIPMARFGLPEEVAKAVRFLLVDGEYITGQSLNINGGMYM